MESGARTPFDWHWTRDVVGDLLTAYALRARDAHRLVAGAGDAPAGSAAHVYEPGFDELKRVRRALRTGFAERPPPPNPDR